MPESENQNASQMPKHYYCLHMQPGICGYGTENVLVDVDAMKRMIGNDAIGKPVYVLHNSSPNEDRIKNLEKESAGYIIDSFYNELDGAAWFEFLVVSDAGHAAVAKGWKVSNAYQPTEWGPAGTKNAVPYDREIVNGQFTHLAIVPDPRYEEACILTPEQFRTYNASKKRQLEELHNSLSTSSGGKPMLKFFKTKREEVSAVDADTQVELEGGRIITVGEMLNSVKKNSDDADAKAEKDKKDKEEKENADKKNAEKLNGDSMVECDGEKMPLKELVNRFMANEKKNADDKEKDEKDKKDKEEKENAERNNARGSLSIDEEAANKHFRELQNAAGIKPTEVQILETSIDRTKRGASRYGSGKAA